MRRKGLADANPNGRPNGRCPISRSLDQVGEWWSILILRDALCGTTRFDGFQRSIGLATNMLARRLRTLVDAGLLERHRYQERPPRYEYRLTEKGRDFLPVLAALAGWGSRWLLPDGAFRFVSTETGRPVAPMLVDRNTGLEITAGTVRPDFADPAENGEPT